VTGATRSARRLSRHIPLTFKTKSLAVSTRPDRVTATGALVLVDVDADELGGFLGGGAGVTRAAHDVDVIDLAGAVFDVSGSS